MFGRFCDDVGINAVGMDFYGYNSLPEEESAFKQLKLAISSKQRFHESYMQSYH